MKRKTPASETKQATGCHRKRTSCRCRARGGNRHRVQDGKNCEAACHYTPEKPAIRLNPEPLILSSCVCSINSNRLFKAVPVEPVPGNQPCSVRHSAAPAPVETRNLVPHVEQEPDNARADIPGSADDAYFHDHPLLFRRRPECRRSENHLAENTRPAPRISPRIRPSPFSAASARSAASRVMPNACATSAAPDG